MGVVEQVYVGGLLVPVWRSVGDRFTGKGELDL